MKKIEDYKIAVAVGGICFGFLTILVAFYAATKFDFFKFKNDGILEKRQNAADKNLEAWRESKEKIKTVREIGASDFVLGNKHGKVQMIVYYDFDCPFSASLQEVVNNLLKKYPEDLRVAVRHFPLESHPGAILAAKAFECSLSSNKGEEMMSELFSTQAKRINDNNFYYALAKGIKLDEDKFKQCLDSNEAEQVVVAEKKEAETFGVIGTPHIFIAGKSLPGSWQENDFTDSDGQRHEGLTTIIDNFLKK